MVCARTYCVLVLLASVCLSAQQRSQLDPCTRYRLQGGQCPQGQQCRLVKDACRQGVCRVYPRCARVTSHPPVIATNPCAVALCLQGTLCVVEVQTPDACPPFGPCPPLTTTCLSRDSPRLSPCSNTLCGPGQTCVPRRPVSCAFDNCLQVPQCEADAVPSMPATATNPCAAALCLQGTICLVAVQRSDACPFGPCPPLTATCLNPDSPRLRPCSTISCGEGRTCVPQRPASCPFGNCLQVAECVDARPANPCLTVKCGPGEVCRVERRVCILVFANQNCRVDPVCRKRVKSGTCPREYFGRDVRCVSECSMDGDCRDNLKCCGRCRRRCVEPTSVSEKPGQCPSSRSGMVGICIARCSTDSNCPGSEKCCGNCPRECREPLFDRTPAGICPRLTLRVQRLYCMLHPNCRTSGQCRPGFTCCGVGNCGRRCVPTDMHASSH